MMAAVTDEPETIQVELDCVTGKLRLMPGSTPPAEVVWSTDMLALIRRGGSLWCSIDGNVIEMRIDPETLWYRLTGEVDELSGTGCLVAVRCTKEGVDWDAQPE